MKQTQQEITQDIAVRRREDTAVRRGGVSEGAQATEEAEELIARTRVIRQRITQASGRWDASAVIREIRHGE